jgi:hypothetical protein
MPIESTNTPTAFSAIENGRPSEQNPFPQENFPVLVRESQMGRGTLCQALH